MFQLILYLTILIGMTGSRSENPLVPNANSRISRKEFVSRLCLVRKDMSRGDVERILGKCDRIRDMSSPGSWVLATGPKEIWCYGVSKEGFATLGSIRFDDNGRVIGICGDGTSPSMDLPDENEVRSLLEMLATLQRGSKYEYDPMQIVRAVNRLWPLGKKRCIAVFEEYLRVMPHDEIQTYDITCFNLLVVLRVLFDVPRHPGHMPEMYLGESLPSSEDGLKTHPRFPIDLVGDWPVLKLSHPRAEIMLYPVYPKLILRSHLDFYQEHCQLRPRPLAPSGR